MKPYRRTLLATAVLLATLPLSSCGDADEFAKTDSITLTASLSTVMVKREVTFTIQSVTPVNQYDCEMVMEYRAEGGGLEEVWAPVPGSGRTRIFTLQPRIVGTLSVMARGKCFDAKEDYKYTAQVNVAVTPVAGYTIEPTLSANPASVEPGKPVTFTLGGTKTEDCTPRFMYQYSGAGFGVVTVDPAYAGQFILTPGAVGTLTVTASAWCTQNTKAVKTVTTTVAVTAAALPTATVTLTGPTTYSLAGGGGVTYAISGTGGTGCTLRLRFQASGAGIVPQDINPATAGAQAPFTPTLQPATVTVIGSAWCNENPSAVVVQTASVAVGP